MGTTCQEGGRLLQERFPLKQCQVHPPMPQADENGRPPSPVQRGKGGNCWDSGAAFFQGGEDAMIAPFGGCAVCVAGGG